MALPTVGTIGTLNINVVDPKSTFNIPRIIVQDVSPIQTAGGIRAWMGNRAPLSNIRTIIWTAKDDTSISTENTALSYIGKVLDATLATAASATDTFKLEVKNANVKHLFSIPDGDNTLNTMTIIEWECYLVRVTV